MPTITSSWNGLGMTDTTSSWTGLDMTVDGQDMSKCPEADLNYVALYFVIVYLSILSVIGAAGNALVLYVFCRKRDTLVSTLFILVLAVVDFVTCLVIMPCTAFMEYVDFHIVNDQFCKVYQFLITSSIPFSAMIMVAIAVDR